MLAKKQIALFISIATFSGIVIINRRQSYLKQIITANDDKASGNQS